MLYFMLFLFAFLSSVYTFGNELKRGTGASLLETGNNSIRLAVAGKMFPYTLIFSGFAMFIAFLLYEIEGMPAIVKAFTALFPFTWWEKLVISQSLRECSYQGGINFLVLYPDFFADRCCFIKNV